MKCKLLYLIIDLVGCVVLWISYNLYNDMVYLSQSSTVNHSQQVNNNYEL